MPNLNPSTIRIPALKVTGRIGTANVDDGVLDPPRDPTAVGIWPGSAPLTASTGEVTIVGHVNWAAMAPFTFGHLADLKPGDTIYTSDNGGNVSSWIVARVTARPKSEPVDQAAFSGPAGPRKLVLITCGGAFDTTDRSYIDNVYVFANPTHM